MKKLGIVLLILFTATCNQAKKAKKPSGSAKLTTEQCNKIVSDAMGSMPHPTNLALDELTVPTSALTVDSSTVTPSAPSASIDVNPSQLGNDGSADISPTFLMWVVCTMNGKTCTNNGNFTKSYNFSIGDITQLPTGTLKASIKLCVDDLKYFYPQDQQIATNTCTEAEPCYCGKTISAPYMNSPNSTQPNTAFVTAVQTLQNARQALLNTSKSYIAQAQDYVSSCSVQDQGKPELQYAANISAYSAPLMASIVESTGDILAALAAAPPQTGLNLDNPDPKAAVCNAAQELSKTEDSGAGGGSDYSDDESSNSGGESSYGPSTASNQYSDFPTTASTDMATDGFTTVGQAVEVHSANPDEGKTGVILLGVVSLVVAATLFTQMGLRWKGHGGLKVLFDYKVMGKVRGAGTHLAGVESLVSRLEDELMKKPPNPTKVKNLQDELAKKEELYAEEKKKLEEKLGKLKEEKPTDPEKQKSLEKKMEKLQLEFDRMGQVYEHLEARVNVVKKVVVNAGAKPTLSDTPSAEDIKQSRTAYHEQKAKIQAAANKKGFMKSGALKYGVMGAIAAVLGAVAVSAGSNLAGSCGVFGQVIITMEGQLNSQGQVVREANLALDTIQSQLATGQSQ